LEADYYEENLIALFKEYRKLGEKLNKEAAQCRNSRRGVGTGFHGKR